MTTSTRRGARAGVCLTWRPRRAAAVCLAGALALAACGGDADPADDAASVATSEEAPSEPTGSEPSASEPSSSAPATGEPTGDATAGDGAVTTADTDLGTILVTGDGATVYGFTQDEQGGASACNEGCLATWPPVLVEGPEVPEGLDADVFGVLERADGGGFQLTADGWPLYTYTPDGPGDTSGQGVGDVWFVVAPDGTLVMDAAGG